MKKDNFSLLAYGIEIYYEDDIYILYWIVTLDNSANEKVSFDSLFMTESNELYDYYYPFNKDSKFYFIQTKNGTIFLSFITDDNELYI